MNAKETAVERLARLVAMVPWIAAQPDGADIDEICRRFATTRDNLIQDVNTVMMVGVHPFTPDMLVDAWTDDERVYVQFAESFDRPLRFTPDEAVRLVSACRAMLSVPGSDQSGPLARATRRLAMAANVGESIEVDLGPASGDAFKNLQEAQQAHKQVRISYGSPESEIVERIIEPIRLFSRSGFWYVESWCHVANGYRVFRLDRITSVTKRDLDFQHDHGEIPLPFDFDQSSTFVTLRVAKRVAWLVDTVPKESVIDEGDALVIRLAIASKQWLNRLLIQLGPDVDIVDESPGFQAQQGALQEAQEVLALYH